MNYRCILYEIAQQQKIPYDHFHHLSRWLDKVQSSERISLAALAQLVNEFEAGEGMPLYAVEWIVRELALMLLAGKSE